MTTETLKRANELKTAIEDRRVYGVELQELLDSSENSNDFRTDARRYNGSRNTTLRDIDARELIETAVARNEKEMKKLQKEFDNLK